jgi:ATP-dependent Zn protease
MTHAHEQARSVSTEHREALDRLAQALLQEEVLERDQVDQVLSPMMAFNKTPGNPVGAD